MDCTSEAVVERKALEHCAERNSSAMSLPSKLNAAHKVYTAFLSGKQTESEQLVSSGSFAGVLQTAVLQGQRHMVLRLVEDFDLQVTIECEDMVVILRTAIQHKSGVITRYLCRTTGAQHLPASSVCDLLEAALKNGDGEAFGYICEELPGVQLLRQDHILKLLQAAVRQPDTTFTCRLCRLSAAQTLTAGLVASLLEAALTDTSVCSMRGSVHALCELLPGARGLTADQLQVLSHAALRRPGSSTVAHLFTRSPAAQDLPRPQLVSGRGPPPHHLPSPQLVSRRGPSPHHLPRPQLVSGRGPPPNHLPRPQLVSRRGPSPHHLPRPQLVSRRGQSPHHLPRPQLVSRAAICAANTMPHQQASSAPVSPFAAYSKQPLSMAHAAAAADADTTVAQEQLSASSVELENSTWLAGRAQSKALFEGLVREQTTATCSMDIVCVQGALVALRQARKKQAVAAAAAASAPAARAQATVAPTAAAEMTSRSRIEDASTQLLPAAPLSASPQSAGSACSTASSGPPPGFEHYGAQRVRRLVDDVAAAAAAAYVPATVAAAAAHSAKATCSTATSGPPPGFEHWVTQRRRPVDDGKRLRTADDAGCWQQSLLDCAPRAAVTIRVLAYDPSGSEDTSTPASTEAQSAAAASHFLSQSVGSDLCRDGTGNTGSGYPRVSISTAGEGLSRFGTAEWEQMVLAGWA